jgi:hypothetical protein
VRRVRADDARLEAKPLEEREPGRLLGEERVGAVLEQQAVVPVERGDDAAGAAARLEDGDGGRRCGPCREFDEAMRRGQPGDPGAEDGDAARRGGRAQGAAAGDGAPSAASFAASNSPIIVVNSG